MFTLRKIIQRAGIFLTLLMPGFVFATPEQTPLKIVSFNILAPCWASPEHYPASSLPLLNREFRRARIIAFLTEQAATTSVFALQETTKVELEYIKQAMNSQFDLYAAYHAPTYWSNWITVNPPWEPNGVALLVKKGLLNNVNFQDLPLSDDGNHCALITGTLTSNSAKKLRVASIHLDSDKSYNRERELSALLKIIPSNNGITDIVAGDMNFDVNKGNLKQNFIAQNFVEVLEYLGNTESTSPYSSSYYKSANWASIDHIMVRGATPIDGKVFNFNLWTLYPTDEEARINANLSICGSDHFPITGTVQ